MVNPEKNFQKRPDTFHPQNESLENKKIMLSNSHLHSLSTKKRPVSATLRFSCFVEDEKKQKDPVLNHFVVTDTKHMRKSMQELSSRGYHNIQQFQKHQAPPHEQIIFQMKKQNEYESDWQRSPRGSLKQSVKMQ